MTYGAPLAAAVIPHGGGFLAILIASIMVCLIAATAAIELRRNVFVWMIGSFVVTFAATSLVHAALASS
ncbi:hypothetical protein [Antrihabitans cavernicola]|uniref:Uncharacterized protein n=1 Tax=Antrihabitans cavernicola TaxID=2495913 RepID=A0A5A7SAF3_9NOCA|nr:hypothetical protein [Spelaeibacter cavernicola]KAA0021191.1 hypothetical protein FOY51_19970 [Spelaeibacter cavernicola]